MLGLGTSLLNASSGGSSAAVAQKNSSNSDPDNVYSTYLDGTNDYLHQPDGTNNIFYGLNNDTDWSLSFYVKLASLNSVIFWKGVYATSKYVMVYCNANGDLSIVGQSNASTFRIKSEWDTNLSVDTWYHVVLTSDGSNTDRVNACYIDKVAQTLNAGNSLTIGSSTPIEYYTGSETLLAGSLDNFAYYEMYLDSMGTWSSALDQANVTAIYQEGPYRFKDSFDANGSTYDQQAFVDVTSDMAPADQFGAVVINGWYSNNGSIGTTRSTDIPYSP